MNGAVPYYTISKNHPNENEKQHSHPRQHHQQQRPHQHQDENGNETGGDNGSFYNQSNHHSFSQSGGVGNTNGMHKHPKNKFARGGPRRGPAIHTSWRKEPMSFGTRQRGGRPHTSQLHKSRPEQTVPVGISDGNQATQQGPQHIQQANSVIQEQQQQQQQLQQIAPHPPHSAQPPSRPDSLGPPSLSANNQVPSIGGVTQSSSNQMNDVSRGSSVNSMQQTTSIPQQNMVEMNQVEGTNDSKYVTIPFCARIVFLSFMFA